MRLMFPRLIQPGDVPDNLLSYLSPTVRDWLIHHARMTAYRAGYTLESEIPIRGWERDGKVVLHGQGNPVWIWYARRR
jgi:hypothetical protein